jgi:quinol monooxygenase YgiN
VTLFAQFITMTIEPGQEGRLDSVFDELAVAEAEGDGVLRLIGMRDQGDPSQAHALVVFESEEKARAREQDPATAVAMRSARELMAEVFVGPPTFIDLTVVRDAVIAR